MGIEGCTLKLYRHANKGNLLYSLPKSNRILSDYNDEVSSLSCTCSEANETSEVISDFAGSTPLLVAAKLDLKELKQGSSKYNQAHKIANFLVESGADVTDIDADGFNMLNWAQEYGNHDIIAELIKHNDK